MNHNTLFAHAVKWYGPAILMILVYWVSHGMSKEARGMIGYTYAVLISLGLAMVLFQGRILLMAVTFLPVALWGAYDGAKLRVDRDSD